MATTPIKRPAEVIAAKATAERILSDVLDPLRSLTHWGWELAYAAAIKDGDLNLASRCRMAQKLAAFRAPGDYFKKDG